MPPRGLCAVAVAAVVTASLHPGVRAQDVVRGVAMPVVRPDVEPPKGTAVVLGRVVDAQTGRPVAHATVALGTASPNAVGPMSTGISQSMTNAEGFFLFRDVARGSYPISVTARGYLAGANGRHRPDGPSRPVTIDDNERITDVVIRLWQQGVLSGTVHDERGDPVVGAAVRALGRTSSGRLTSAAQALTDDRGAYRLAGLTPGDYYVAVPSYTGSIPASIAETFRQPGSAAALEARRDLPPQLMSLTLGAMQGIRVGDAMVSTAATSGGNALLPQPGPDGRLTGYQTAYHPGAQSLTDAVAVRVNSGEERADVDVHLRLAPMLTISGTVVGPDGPVSSIGIMLTPAHLENVSGLPGLDTSGTLSGPDGRFLLHGAAPGQYRLRAVRIPRPTPTNLAATGTTINLGGGGMLVMGGGVPDVPPASDLPTLWADLPIGVGDRDVIGVNLTLATGARLTGQVVFEGSPPTPAEMPRLGVGLVAADDGAGQLPPIAPVDLSTRQFRTAQYPAGRYLLNLPAPPGGWSVRSAIVDGVNINEQPLVLSGSDISGVVVTLSRQPTTLSGSVRRGVGTGDPRAAVAVFPADYHAWIESGMSGRRFRTTAVQADGTFEIAGLGAGEYLVAVVGAEYPMDGRNPATIDALASVATRVSVREGINQAPALGVSMLR